MDYENLTPEQLVEECTRLGRPEAWREFVRRFQPLIAGVVARTAQRYGECSATVVDDLVQETYLRLCTEEWRRLREFESRHSGAVYGFIKAVARTVALDYFKIEHADKRGAHARIQGDFDSILQTVAQSDPVNDRILAREIDERVGQIAETARDRWIFFLYYRHGFTTRAIAEMPGIQLSQKGVESCLNRLTRQLQRDFAGPVRS